MKRLISVLLLLAIQTGLRASELVNLQCGDVMLGSGAHIRCMGKGRKGGLRGGKNGEDNQGSHKIGANLSVPTDMGDIALLYLGCSDHP